MRRAALAAAIALAAVTLARQPAAWESGNALNHVSGTWLALADDLARGSLYRPLQAEDGAVGGTRYFPLVFALEACLLAAGLPPVAAGEAASLAAGLLLAAALVALLLALGAGGAEALAAAALAFAGAAGQHALSSARGDLLPVALSALALAVLARAGPARVGAAALLLVLAFAAKPTALSASLAAVAALAVRGDRRGARWLAGLVAAGAGGVVLATEVLSSGRFLAAFRATAAAGLGARSALAAPVRLAAELAEEDPAGLFLAVLALGALCAAAPALVRAVRGGAADPRLVPALWLAAAWVTALAVYASPGTGVNHLLEVEAASAALLAASAAAAPTRAGLARAACAVAAAAGLAGAVGLWHADRATSRLAELRAVVAALPAGPILSEDPLVPLLAGASPLVLDPFALRIVSSADGGLAAPLAAGLRAGAFAAVVLLADVDRPAAGDWYARGNLGLPLVAAVRAGYRSAGSVGRYHLYLPRGPRAPGPGPGDGSVVRRDDAR